jgi:hypothetical protein
MSELMQDHVLDLAWNAAQTANKAFDAMKVSEGIFNEYGSFIPEDVSMRALSKFIDAASAFNMSCDIVDAVTASSFNPFWDY